MIEFQWQAAQAGARPDLVRLESLPAVRHVRDEGERITLSVTEPHVAIPAILNSLPEMHCELSGLTTRHASLEDVFVKVAGRSLSDSEGEAAR